VLAAQRFDAALAIEGLVGLTVFALMVWFVLKVPHVTVAFVVAFFAVLPAMKVLVFASLGPTKDAIVMATAVASALRAYQRRAAGETVAADGWVAVLAGLVFFLYLFDVGGFVNGSHHGLAWVHGVRLQTEPLLLLLYGLTAMHPRRALEWGCRSLAATCVFVSLYGLLQQLIGPWGLYNWGYSFEQQLRVLPGGTLRSFGTLDEAFAYAAFLLFGIVVCLLWMRPGPLRNAVFVIVALGLAASTVRTAAVIVVALFGVALLARRRRELAGLLLALALAGAVVVVAANTHSATTTRTVQASPSLFLTLNGRTSTWTAALGRPRNWVFGRGVGVVGKAASRATYSITASSTPSSTQGSSAVDSGYISMIADVGVVGLLVFLGLLFRLGQLSWRSARRFQRTGWLALGLLTVMLLDALTRDSFTGFPTAFLGMLLVGLAIAADRDGSEPPSFLTTRW
jgi:hypothetical protein